MKKIQVLALGAIASIAISCDGGGGGNIPTSVTLTSAYDTLAYAYGVEVGDKGLPQYLAQVGVLTDTAQFRMTYMYQIQAEADQAKKTQMENALPAKIDSINKANTKNMADFLAGIKEVYNAPKSKSAYMQGLQVGSQLLQTVEGMSKQIYGEDSEETINKDMLLAGVVTALKKEKAQLENTTMIVEMKMQQLQEEKIKRDFAVNLEAGKKFLEENKTKEGVQTLPSGLQYKVIKEGTGAKPTDADRVKVHYHGTLIDGTVFDSSVDKGEPVVFGVGQVIRGWTEALKLMPVGSKWIIYVPEDLAYGSRQAGNIQPFSTLIFEVELLNIEK